MDARRPRRVERRDEPDTGRGDSLNAFDVTAALMTAGVGFIATLDASWASGVHALPRQAWGPVAAKAAGV